jgi:SAM-dependent methyltransferase
MMRRLTDRRYWEAQSHAEMVRAVPAPNSRIKRALKRALGERIMNLLSPYDSYLLWDVALPQHLPARCAGLSVLEVGSAPGDFLVQFANRFGATPYGVEYTHHGCELNRTAFKANGFDPRNVLEGDFLSEEFAASNRERFDIVVSRGFIEHFDDVEPVLAQHVTVLKPGGLLIVMIPKLDGIYYPWTKIFNPALLPLHNLDIMKLLHFRQLFAHLPVDPLQCGYFGTFNFWMFTVPDNAPWLARTSRLLVLLQRALNLGFRLVFGARGCESAMFSPNLLFIGRKR